MKINAPVEASRGNTNFGTFWREIPLCRQMLLLQIQGSRSKVLWVSWLQRDERDKLWWLFSILSCLWQYNNRQTYSLDLKQCSLKIIIPSLKWLVKDWLLRLINALWKKSLSHHNSWASRFTLYHMKITKFRAKS